MCKETGLGEVMAAGVASLELSLCPACALSLLCYSYSHYAGGLYNTVSASRSYSALWKNDEVKI